MVGLKAIIAIILPFISKSLNTDYGRIESAQKCGAREVIEKLNTDYGRIERIVSGAKIVTTGLPVKHGLW